MTVSLIRTLILYVTVIAAMRLMGKRQIGELEPSDLVITILISELAAIEGGPPEALVKAWFCQNELDRLTVTIPGWNRPLLACLNRYAEGMEMTPCEKIQILRYRPVLEALLTLKGHYAPLADGVLALEADGQTVTVTVTDGAVQVADGGDSPWKLTHREMHELLLNPFAVDLQERAPRGWFPLPWHTPTADTF